MSRRRRQAAPAPAAAPERRALAFAEAMLPSDRMACGLVSFARPESTALQSAALPDGIWRVAGSRWQFHVQRGRIVQAVRADRAGYFSAEETLVAPASAE